MLWLHLQLFIPRKTDRSTYFAKKNLGIAILCSKDGKSFEVGRTASMTDVMPIRCEAELE
jgi:hypothetical protein